MIQPVYLYNSSVLTKPTDEVLRITPFIEETIINMKDTVLQGGVGLSAPQIGVAYKLFLISMGKKVALFINPELVEESEDTNIITEGCLSFPGIGIPVKRANKIKVVAQDLFLTKQEYELEGITARLFLHELDHLHGIFMHQRMESLNTGREKKYINKYLKKLKKGEFTEDLTEKMIAEAKELLIPKPAYQWILEGVDEQIESKIIGA